MLIERGTIVVGFLIALNDDQWLTLFDAIAGETAFDVPIAPIYT